MSMSRTHKEHTTKWRPCAGMPIVGVYVLSLSLSPINTFGGGLGQGQARSIDSRHIRH
jgi:hypothetical protein